MLRDRQKPARSDTGWEGGAWVLEENATLANTATPLELSARRGEAGAGRVTLFGWSTGLEEILRYAQDDSIDGSGGDCHTDKHRRFMRRRCAALRNDNRFRWVMQAKPPEVIFWRLVETIMKDPKPTARSIG